MVSTSVKEVTLCFQKYQLKGWPCSGRHTNKKRVKNLSSLKDENMNSICTAIEYSSVILELLLSTKSKFLNILYSLEQTFSNQDNIDSAIIPCIWKKRSRGIRIAKYKFITNFKKVFFICSIAYGCSCIHMAILYPMTIAVCITLFL